MDVVAKQQKNTSIYVHNLLLFYIVDDVVP